MAFIVGLCLWAGAHNAMAQPGFIKHFDAEQQGRGATGKAIREVPDGYLFFCDQITDDGSGQTHIHMRRLDAAGEQISVEDLFSENPRQSNYGFMDPVCRMASGYFAVPVIDNTNGYDRGIFIYVFDQQGDTVLTYHPLQCHTPDSVVITTDALLETSTGEFLLVGSVDSLANALDTHAMLVRMSSTAEVLSVREYGLPGQLFHANAVAEYEDGAVIFGYRGGVGIDDENFLIRVDAEGDEMWRRYCGYDRSGSYGAVEITSDGEIITWCGYKEPDWPMYYWEVLLTKWDADGGIIWQYHTHYNYTTTPADMELLDDGSIIATAMIDDKGALCKFNAAGDSLWTRIYRAFPTNNSHFFWDVEPTSDGGFIACGDAVQTIGDPTPGLYTLWIVKTDSLGCVVPGCATVGVEEYVVDLTEQLQLAPNPASDHVQVTLPLPPKAVIDGGVQVVVQDALGREVLRQPVPNATHEIRYTLDVSDLPAGSYYLHLRDKTKWLAGGKVIVER